MTIADLVYSRVKAMPEHQAREVLDFVGYLSERGALSSWRDLADAQASSLAAVWDNDEDQVWDDV